ncbi:MAG: MTH1187 family thiamine-binding protein [Nitrososphaera sp.]|jgi:uncharacterized protein (TIGR00106 family)
MAVHAEISIVPITGRKSASMSTQIAAAFKAIRSVRGVHATLTALGTQIEAENLERVLEAVSAAHMAARSSGAQRIITSVRIDERLDKNQTLEDKIESVSRKLSRPKRR